MRILKRTTAFVLSMAIVLGIICMAPISFTTVKAASTNLLEEHNFSFEETVSGSNFPADWTAFNAAPESMTSVVTDHYSNGNSCLMINNENSSQTVGLYSAAVPVTAGTSIMVSVDVLGSGQLGAHLRFYENAEDSVPLQSDYFPIEATNVWTSLTFGSPVTVPAGATAVRVLLYVGGSNPGKHYFDNAIIRVVDKQISTTPTASGNLLSNDNFSFELTDSTNQPAGWTMNANATGRVSVTKNAHSHQDSALKIDLETNPLTSGVVALYSAMVPVTPGDTIAASVDVKGTGSHGFYLRFYNGVTYTDVQINDWKTNADPNEWETIEVKKVAPEGANYAQVWLYVSSAAATHYYDNISIRSLSAIPVGNFPEDNMLLEHNYNFSEKKLGSNLAADWTLYNSEPNRVTIVDDPKNAGNTCLKIDTQTVPPDTVVAAYSAFFPVTVGDDIKVNVDVLGTGQHIAYLRFYDKPNGTLLGNINEAIKDNTEWETMTIQGEVPAGAAVAQIWLYVGKAEAIHYFDNVTVSKYDPMGGAWPEDNMLQEHNYDFSKKSDTTHVPLGWKFYKGAPGRMVVTTDPTNAQNSCLKIDTAAVPIEDSAVSAYTTNIPVYPGDSIELSVDTMGTGGHGVYLRFYDNTNTQIAISDAWKYDGTEWQTAKIKTVVPENAVYAQVWLWVGKEPNVHYYDNVKFVVHSMRGHEMTLVPEKPATTTETGHIAYYTCSCGKLLQDSVHTIVIPSLEDTVLPKVKNEANLLGPYNPSFDASVVGGVPVGWIDYRTSNEAYRVTTSQANDGTSSLKLTIDDSVTSPVGIYSSYFPVKVEYESLSVMFDFKGQGYAQVYMYYFDENMQPVEKVAGSPDWINQEAMATWNTFLGKFPIPEGAKYGRILLYRSHADQGELYYDNVIVKKAEHDDGPARPKEINDSFEDGCDSKGLPWGWSEFSNDQKNNAYRAFKTYDTTKDTLPEGAPKPADGNSMVAFTQIADESITRGMWSPYIDVSGMKALWGSVEVYGTSTVQVYIKFYDEAFQNRSEDGWSPYYPGEADAGEWTSIGLEASVPEGARYARLLVMKSYTEYFLGTSYLDMAVLREAELNLDANTVPPIPEYVEYDWTIKESGHPRVFFNEAELRRIKKFAASDKPTSMGYTGAEAYAELISLADKYLNETSFRMSFTAFYVDIPLYPKLEDACDLPEWRLAPGPGYAIPYPYLTGLGEEVKDRMKTLALAYAISGETKYADRAIQYTLDLCEWEYWIGKFHIVENSPYGETSDQATGYFVDGAATVYDMCYDLLTPEQRKTIENGIIEKALEPFAYAMPRRMERVRDMDHGATMYTAVAAIINEDNIDQMSKYLNLVMQYNKWIFDWYDNGHNEGYDYAANGIDQLVVGMGQIERVTGMAGMLDHHFFTDTLRNWIFAGVELGSGTMVGYSDSPYRVNFLPTLTVMANRGDSSAGYIVHRMGGGRNPIEKFTQVRVNEDYIWQPDDDYMNVIVDENLGYGSLRTGWGSMEKLLFIYSDNYNVSHSHWEANSIYLAAEGEWLLKDVGYGSIEAGRPKTKFDQRYSVTSIFVDNKPQSVKGTGRVRKVLDGYLYGQVVGSAPQAYGRKNGGVNVVDKFDRHLIMMNHDSESYYVVIDDLASTIDHIYGFNMHHTDYDRIELNGKPFDMENPTMGNHFAMLKYSKVLHVEMVGKPLEFAAHYFTNRGETFGPVFRANSALTKNHQFMSVISVDPSYEGVQTIDATDLLLTRNSNLTRENPKGWSWSSSNDGGMVIALPLPDYGVNMFRARDIGDWMSFPFEVKTGGEYLLSLKLGSFTQYAGNWQAYLDGEPIGEPYAAKSGKNMVISVPMGKFNLTEGTHTIKMELVSDPETADLEWGSLISMGVVTLEKEGEVSLGNSATSVLESYDTDTTLGATIRYGTVLSDIVLSNKGTGMMSGGNLTSDGAQATVMGLYNSEITEGYSLTKGTSLAYGDTVLVAADGVISLSVDRRLSRMPIKNTDDEEPIELDPNLNVKKPTTIVNTNAEADRVVSIYVGNDAPYTAAIDGTEVETTYNAGVLTLTIPAGEHQVKVVGTHNCVFDQMATNILNIKTWATCTDPHVYYVSCVCGENGTETFTAGEPRGHNIVAVAAKEPTETENGCIAHFYCKTCKKYFADAEGKVELKESDVILLSGQAKDLNNTITWIIVAVAVLLLAGGAFALMYFKFGFFRKKATDEEAPIEDTPAEDTPTEE